MGAAPNWQKTQYSNLIRYVPSGMYFARLRVRGKLIRQSLKTDQVSVAKLRLADLERTERQSAEDDDQVRSGKLDFAGAAEILRGRVRGDARLKPRTKNYYEECLIGLFKSWPELKAMDLRRITRASCLAWAAQFSAKFSPSLFNHTISAKPMQ